MIAPRVPRGATSRLRSPTALLHFHGILRSTGGLGREARTPIVVRSGRSHQKAATMLLTLLATIVGMPLAITDTTVTFGVVKRDLTGDSIPEVLTLSGTGDTIDSLEVTFTIQSSGRTRYSRTWRVTRASFDQRRRISDAELWTRLTEYGNAFFADSKFMSPTRFLTWLQASARLHIPLIPEVIARDMTP